MNATQRAEVKAYVDQIMGACAGDGVSPATAACMVAENFGVALSPRQVWNLWIDGDEE